MKKSLLSLAVICTLVSASSFATIIPAELVGTKNGGNVQTNLDQLNGQVGGLSNDVWDIEQRNARQDKDIHDTYVLANTKYTEAAGKALEGEVRNNKADQAVRDQGQDDHINAVQDAAQTANDRAGNLETRADVVEQNVRDTNAQVAVTDQRSINNAVRLDGVEQTNTRQDAEIATKVSTSTFKADQDRQDKALTSGLAQKVDNTTYAQRNTVVDQRFADTNTRIAAHKAEQDKVNQAVAGRLDNHEGRITSLEQQSASKWKSLKSQMDSNHKDAMAGVSSAIAAASIPQVMEAGEFGIGAGVGTYGDENGLAVGASYAPRSNVVLKLNVTTDSASNFGAGAGVMVSFH